MSLQNKASRWVVPSVGRSPSHSAAGDNNKPPVSSISRISSSSTVKTSVYGHSLPQAGMGHPGAGDGQDAMDNARYGYVRGLVKKRQAREAEQAGAVKSTASQPKPAKPSKYKLKLGTGVTFSRSLPRGGFERTMRHMRSRDYKRTFRNLSPENVKFFGDLVQKHATCRPTGSGWHRKDRMNMMEEVEKARHEGRISWADKKDFRKIIEQLE